MSEEVFFPKYNKKPLKKSLYRPYYSVVHSVVFLHLLLLSSQCKTELVHQSTSRSNTQYLTIVITEHCFNRLNEQDCG